jgi:NitT/TauT family transport system permease protein
MKSAAPPLALMIVLLIIWQASCQILAIPPYLLPAPSRVGVALVNGAPRLAASAWRTLSMALEALVAASLIATSLAFVVNLNRSLDRAVRPLAVAVQVTPVVAIAPLVGIWAGVEHPSSRSFLERPGDSRPQTPTWSACSTSMARRPCSDCCGCESRPRSRF